MTVMHQTEKAGTSLAVDQVARREKSIPPAALHPAHVKSEVKASLGVKKQREERKDETNRGKN